MINSARQFFLYIRWPATIGLIVALVVLVFTPTKDTKPSVSSIGQALNVKNTLLSGPVSYADAVERAAPAVVNIYTKKSIKQRRHPFFEDPTIRRFFNRTDLPEQQRMQQNLGSGVIVSERGFILTSLHVIQGADEIAVALQDGREAQAEVMGVNRERDLAVLHIPLEDITAIRIGDPSKLRVGDVVLAIGNPFGIGQTVTQGIISATQRKDLKISLFEGFIQTDADIYEGNSGGALVDARGNLVGINAAKIEMAGISFAIPVDIAIQTLNDIVEHGRVVRGWLGVEARLLTPQVASQLKINLQQGILVTRTDIGSPAEKAGLRPGDVIVGINNQPTEDIITGWQRIAESRPGETVSIEFVRDHIVMHTNAVLGELPELFN